MNDPFATDSKKQDEVTPPIEIPIDALSPEVLRAVIESYILREGTDYGWQETDLETKMDQVKRQLTSGKIKIAFDPASESVTLLTASDWKKLHNRHT